MSISKLARSIVESPTLRLNEEARILREKGEPVIHLGSVNPKTRPHHRNLQLSSQTQCGDIKYTPTDGLPSLKKAIIKYTEENYNKLVGLKT
jgi:aspartate aminotransferase